MLSRCNPCGYCRPSKIEDEDSKPAKESEILITALALFILGIAFAAAGFGLMKYAMLPSVMEEGAGFIYYYAGFMTLLLGFGVLASAALASVVGIAQAKCRSPSKKLVYDDSV